MRASPLQTLGAHSRPPLCPRSPGEKFPLASVAWRPVPAPPLWGPVCCLPSSRSSPRLRGQPAYLGTPPTGQAGRLTGGRKPLPPAPPKSSTPAPPPRHCPGWTGSVCCARCWGHRSLLHFLRLWPRDSSPGPRIEVQGERVWLLLQVRGSGEAKACRELSQLQALRTTGIHLVTQVPEVQGIFSWTYTAHASWRELTRDTGSWDTRCYRTVLLTQRPPAVRPGTGAPPSSRSQLSPWGQPGWGGGPAWACALLACLIPALGAVRSRRPVPWHGLDFRLQPPGPGPRVLCFWPPQCARAAFLSRPGSPRTEAGRVWGQEASGGLSREVGAVEIEPGAGPASVGPSQQAPSPR